MILNKQLSVLGLAACMSASIFISSVQADSRTPVGKINLSFTSELEEGESGGEVKVSTSSSKCYIDDVVIINDMGEWTAGSRPELRVYVAADDGYYFSSEKNTVFSLSGAGATFVKADTRNNESEVIVTVLLGRVDGSGVGNVNGMDWDEDSALAEWEDMNGAEKYQVKLYRGSKIIGSTVTTEDTSYDFSKRITGSGYYKFMVRSVGDDGDKGDWVESEEWYVSSSEAKEFSGLSDGSVPDENANASGGPGQSTAGWIQDQKGWWYQNGDSTYTRNNWQQIKNIWYFFDENGYMKTGWISWNNIWYYCDSSGAMLSNATTPDGFYVNADGVYVP